MESSLISFVCPVYNREAMVAESIRPLFESKLESFEFIFVDDCSSDGSVAECERLAKDHESTVKVISLEENKGAPHARNVGRSAAKGEFIVFVDSDDVPIPDGYEDLRTALLDDTSLDFTFGNVIETDADCIPLSPQRSVGGAFDASPREIAGYHWHTMGAIYRTSFLQRLGDWNCDLTGSQDWEFQARAKIASQHSLYVPTEVGLWRHHDGQRVGATSFRPDYVRSLMKASSTILQNARHGQKSDVHLESRLAKKLALHALEWGAHGYHTERQECFDLALSFLSTQTALARVITLAKLAPSFADGLLWKQLIRT